VYREFSDVPRLFYVEHDGRYFVFDCVFDVARDDYAPGYTVYAVAKEAVPTSVSWDDLLSHGVVTGWLPVDEVEFDRTGRRAILASVMQHLH
jgi:hypothetical protein